ncbi:hypothetical protein, partial [Escherichia coli]|uniref:hypothetical protein n=1 Tax=Escherichia coli TaxID=562 RepID=UPI0019D42723
ITAGLGCWVAIGAGSVVAGRACVFRNRPENQIVDTTAYLHLIYGDETSLHRVWQPKNCLMRYADQTYMNPAIY